MLFASVFMMYPRAAVSASRIQEALDMEPAIREEEGVTETATKGYLEFKNVTFAYPGHAESPVIRNVSLRRHLVKQWPSLGAQVVGNQH